jgi:hypothetical protein
VSPLSDEQEHSRRGGDGKIQWQAIAVIISVLMAVSALGKTWFLNDYRLEQVEKRVEQIDAKIEKLDERMVKLDTTYHLLIEQARDHGWNIPWVPRGKR